MATDEYRAMQDRRRAAIRAAANLLESVDRARRSRERLAHALPARGPSPERSRDLLFDVLRLNARYLNQLAALGTAHGHRAHQTLERLYSLLVPQVRRSGGAAGPAGVGELLFTRRRRRLKFVIDNRLETGAHSATLRWEELDPPASTSRWVWKIDGEDVRRKRSCTISVPPGSARTIEIVARGRLPSRRHRSEIVIELGDVRRRMPVLVDYRDDR